jgi:hypothetical protein
LSLFFPAEDPALIGRCYRGLIAPLSGPIKDQDLRVVAPVLRLSVVLAASEVAEAVSLVLPRVGQFLEAADDVSAREILRSVTVVFPRHAEVLGGFTEVIMAVAAMVAVMAVVAVVTMMVVVVVAERIIQETSEERCGKKWQHSYSPLSLGVPAPASCRRSGACRRCD